MSTSTTKRRGSLTAEADEEVRDVEHVRRVARRVVVHPVRLAALVRDDVEQDVHRAVAVLRCGAVPASARAQKRVRTLSCRMRLGPCAPLRGVPWRKTGKQERGETDAQDRHAEDDRLGPRDAEHGELAVALRAPHHQSLRWTYPSLVIDRQKKRAKNQDTQNVKTILVFYRVRHK